MKSKKLSKKGAKKLLSNPDLYKKSEDIKKIQEMTGSWEDTNKSLDIWIISDFSSNFPSINTNNG